MKLSIVTVCFNAAREIAPTLQSVKAQTFPNIEYIVVDGGSSDCTLDVIRDSGVNITKLITEPDLGIYNAMNKGLAESTGDIIAFMNAGDYYVSPLTVEMVMDFFLWEAVVDVAYGGLEVRHPDGARHEFVPTEPDGALEFLVTGSLPHQATFARRRAFGATGPFSDRFRSHSDYEWFLKIATQPRLSLARLPFTIASFGLGGASGLLEVGERERHHIQNGNPTLSSPAWLSRRVELYQELYIGLRTQLEARN